MSEPTTIPYGGSELELFADAIIWRGYWQAQLAGFVGKRVLEVGAGLGTVARSIPHWPVERWVALEPDPDMASRLLSLSASGALPAFCESRRGTTADLAPDEQFDTVMYVDVLEHIEHDRAELARAVRHVARNGTLIVLAPAHRWLYSSFDAAIGHFRRYKRSGLLDLGPPDLCVARARYLDAAGLLASLANRVLLRQSAPTPAQIRVWDRFMVPLSRWLDPLLGFSVGKSVLVIWRKS
ncbi:MAG TPA: class I SAM-dependent methyltransferase [Rhodopila sp.]